MDLPQSSSDSQDSCDGDTIVLRRPWAKRVQDYRQILKCHLIAKASVFSPQFFNKQLFSSLRYYCCFVGHGRSGGTLVGALLNAHPNIVMSNELHALRQLAFGLSGAELYRVIYLVSRRQARRGSKGGGGYSYEVSGQWQGKHDELLVIGDRKAGASALEISRNPKVLDLLERKVDLAKRFIHVARNPFDNITTTFKKTLARPGETAQEHLAREVNNYFGRCRAVQLVESRFGVSSVCHVSHELLIENPGNQISRLCQFLDLECTPGYLQACTSVVKPSPSMTRLSLDWPDLHKRMVLERIQNYHWLKAYRFEP